MSGHDWSWVDTGWGAFDEHGASSNQYRLPASVFGEKTPTVRRGQNDGDATLEALSGGEVYSTPTFEDAGRYYGGSEQTKDGPVGQWRAEDAGEPVAYVPIDRAAASRNFGR